MQKTDLLSFFSDNYEKFYKVSLFDRLGFNRQHCKLCGKHFWSITQKSTCPDHENYSFIGNPPTSKRLNYTEAWNETKKYFENNGHKIVNRYPVVCRWRDDLYYTIASIVDFQRVVENKVVFEIPSNPLLVPQICLRFNDIENVGTSGRHYTSFCMIGQTCNSDKEGGYWKDKCIELDFGLLVDVLGIPPNDITFVEDVWIGAGAFGSSLEYFVGGLELGNAVFTEFEGTENNYQEMKNKIIDMGAGLERFSWITKGTPTSYDCTFEPVLQGLYDKIGLNNPLKVSPSNGNEEFLSNYFGRISQKLSFNQDIHTIKKQIAKDLGIEYDILQRKIVPYESLYTIVDHTKTLIFAIADGSLPSNVGGGYNLRVLLRRALSILAKMKFNLKISDIVDLHIKQLHTIYPELKEFRDDIHTILNIESKRFSETQSRINTISTKIKKGKDTLEIDDLIRLYESDGITPEHLVESGVIEMVPSNFYIKLSEIHSTVGQNKKVTNEFDFLKEKEFELLPKTRLLYYEDPSLFVFKAKVLKVINQKLVILDQTCFYPRGGGQEPDFGYINADNVHNVIKVNDIVIHQLISPTSITEGQTVEGIIEKERRQSITKNHTSTHIINQSSKSILGSWVWQNSAFKEENYARLDITHHSALNREEVQAIEDKANDYVRSNLPVFIKNYDRGIAEQSYGFRIYQGGAVPSRNVRIVNVGDIDIEACGGTHVLNTGEIGIIKILKTERIQDGVVRIEFVSGKNALKFIQSQEQQIQQISSKLNTRKDKVVETFTKNMDEFENTKKKIKNILRNVSPIYSDHISKNAQKIESVKDKERFVKLFFTVDHELDEDFHLSIGQKTSEVHPDIVYIAIILNSDRENARVIVYSGYKSKRWIKAGEIARKISQMIDGSGGGSDNFGQGGGKSVEKVTDIPNKLKFIIQESLE